MKLLVIGAGSIGRRHVINSSEFADTGVYDINHTLSTSVSEETGSKVFNSLDEAIAWSPNGAIIATPHTEHVSIANILIDAGIDILIEKPISNQIGDATSLISHAGAAGRQVYVACNMRFHPGPVTISKYLDTIGKPLYCHAYFGHWLPNMRPDVDYRNLYCARNETGGGVLLDGIHELDYLIWIFGQIKKCDIKKAKLSELDIDVEDYAAMNLIHSSGVHSEVHLDYIQQCKRRGCEVIGTDGTIIWESEGKNPEKCSVRLYQRQSKKWETIFNSDDLDINMPYKKLIELFVSTLNGKSEIDLLDGKTALEEVCILLNTRDNYLH